MPGVRAGGTAPLADGTAVRDARDVEVLGPLLLDVGGGEGARPQCLLHGVVVGGGVMGGLGGLYLGVGTRRTGLIKTHSCLLPAF
jgi:hypothetical protein